MPSELKRGVVRIASNYARLLATVALGMALVPILIVGLGPEGFGLTALLGSSVGIAGMIQEIVRTSMIRELGRAHHSDDPTEFPKTYNAAVAASLGAGIVVAITFALLAAFIHVLQIPPALEHAARVFVVLKGIEIFFVILLAPAFNMYVVAERMIANNIWQTFHRLTYTAAAAYLFLWLGIRDPAQGVILYGYLSTGLFLLLLVIPVALVRLQDPRLAVRPSLITRAALRDVLYVGGWNSAVTVAMNLHLRVDAILVNLFGGLTGSAVFGIASQLVGYSRRLTIGVIDGLDAVSARMSSKDEGEQLAELMRHTNRLQAFVTAPATVATAVLAQPILYYWIEMRTAEPPPLGPTVLMTQLLAVGMAARALSDGWVRILYGAGRVRDFAPLVLLGGICNPIVAVLLGLVMGPDSRMFAPAVAFTVVMTIFHQLLLPRIVARCTGVTYGQVLRPALGPTLVALACSPILIIPALRVEGVWRGAWVLADLGAYGIVYAGLCAALVMTRPERRIFTRGFMRLIGKGGRRAAVEGGEAGPASAGGRGGRARRRRRAGAGLGGGGE